MSTRVVVLDDYQQVARSHGDWDRLGTQVAVTYLDRHLTGDDLVAQLRGAQIVCIMRERTPFPRELFAQLPDLQLLVNTGMHNASVDLAGAREHGVTVCGTDSTLEGTAELTWGLVLALARHLPEEDANLRAGRWQQHVGTLLRGRTLGLLGLGRLGSLVAHYGQAFGMEVIAWSQNLTDERARSQGVTRVDRLELFERADVLSVHVKLSERTRGLVGRTELVAMKPGATLVNTSRSPIVDRGALIEALHAGQLAGAALDVHPTEPIPADDPILTAPNTVLTPHIGYVIEEGYDLYYRQTVEVIEAWLDGRVIREMTSPRHGR